MSSSLVMDSKEVVRIKAKKCNGLMQPEYKKLCVDPQLTSFDILQNLLVRAFDIKSDFAISYLATDDNGQSVYLSLLSDWDLDAAFLGSSNPYLCLKVDLKPFEEGLDDWDIVAPCDITKTTTRAVAVNLTSSIIDTITKKVSTVTKAIGLKQDDGKDVKPLKAPMSDAEFHNFLDTVGHLVQPKLFRLAVYQGGVEPSLRRVVWRHLLNIYPDDMNGKERFDYLKKKSNEYYKLRDDWRGKETGFIQFISNMVKKDVLRTDRNHWFFAGADENEHLVALFNILVTYGVTHPDVGYCQGMSDLASPLLVVEKDESHAYICFCSLMRRLRNNFSEDGILVTKKFEHLGLLLEHYDPVFAAYLRQDSPDMFFSYRWILLEMKREFPLDDALFMLETMWSTLPLDPPDSEISLADANHVDAVATASASPSTNHGCNYVQMRSLRRRISTTTASETKTTGGTTDETRPLSDDSGDLDPTEFVRIPLEVYDEMEKKSSQIDRSVRSTIGSGRTSSLSETVAEETGSRAGRATVAAGGDFELERILDEDVRGFDPKRRPNRIDLDRSKDADLAASESDETTLFSVELSSCEEVDENTNLLEPSSVDFVQVAEADRPVRLPSPVDFGCGNPFLIFLCLSLLVQHRDHIMSNRMDYNEIAVFFDRMVRKHNVQQVVHQAKCFYSLYLRQQQQLESDNSDSDLNV